MFRSFSRKKFIKVKILRRAALLTCDQCRAQGFQLRLLCLQQTQPGPHNGHLKGTLPLPKRRHHLFGEVAEHIACMIGGGQQRDFIYAGFFQRADLFDNIVGLTRQA